MIIKGHKRKCDQCGKESEWILESEDNTIASVNKKDWFYFNLSEPEYGNNYKDYCSKDCVKKTIDSL